MRRLEIGLVVLVLLVLPSIVTAGVITFDGIPNLPVGWAPLSTSYDGYSWQGFWYVLSNGTQYGATLPAPMYSPPNGVSNGWGIYKSVLSSATPFVFGGAYIIPWDPQVGFGGPITGITVEGYLGSTLVFSDTYPSLNGLSYTHILGYSGAVDSVNFLTDPAGNLAYPAGDHWWIMDNISVPEPSLVLLLGLGLGAVTLIAWRFKG
jgi:hypothetical protein